MKNIHLLPTEKPSRLYKDSEKLKLDIDSYGVNNQNIYITSDEEIKEGDWLKRNNPNLTTQQNDKIYKCSFLHKDGTIQPIIKDLSISKWKQEFCKKIILTTDQDLIADGVQPIDDEFLEWFIKNPSCEFVEIKLVEFEVDMGLGDECIEHSSYYKIIIPQEEPKQKTLEEAAKILYPDGCDGTDRSAEIYRRIFIEGAKWEQERMYSEAIEFAEWIRIKDFQTTSKNNWIGLDMKYYTTQELFEQFKKK